MDKAYKIRTGKFLKENKGNILVISEQQNLLGIKCTKHEKESGEITSKSIIFAHEKKPLNNCPK